MSLLVGAMGILTIMWISVHERTNEIGLLRALGVPRSTVQGLFLLESVLLAVAGGAHRADGDLPSSASGGRRCRVSP